MRKFMKYSVLLFVALTAYTVAAVPLLEKPEEFKYPRFLKVQHESGESFEIDLEQEPDMDFINEYTRNPANNAYYLYTRQNPTSAQTLIANNAASILNSNFNPNRPTLVVVHGWLSNEETSLNPEIRDAYLSKQDGNVIILEWRRAALQNYATAASLVPAIGEALGQMMNLIHTVTGAPYTSMHLAGFSLGAHLVGNAGRATGGRVSRVTGLDPAGPLWQANRQRLQPTDGRYVEAIHTDGGYTVGGLGIGTAIANVDFFPNGGISQPGCLTNLCNHNRGWRFFAATIRYNHLVGNLCTTTLQITLNTCRGSQFRMGNDDLNKWGTGMYRLDTGRSYPY